MTELEMLIAQKREIEARIRALRDDPIISGDVKFGKQVYCTSRPDDWYVAVFVPTDIHYKGKKVGNGRWQKIIVSPKRDEVFTRLPEVIYQLADLYKQIEKREEEHDAM